MSPTFPAPDPQLSYQPGNEMPGAAPRSGVWNRPTTPGNSKRSYPNKVSSLSSSKSLLNLADSS